MIISRSSVAVVVASLLLAACSSQSGTVDGIVVNVEGTLTEVNAFTVLAGGEEMAFRTLDDGDYEFPLPHLSEHQRTGEPVQVDWVEREGVRYAVAVRDG